MSTQLLPNSLSVEISSMFTNKLFSFVGLNLFLENIVHEDLLATEYSNLLVGGWDIRRIEDLGCVMQVGVCNNITRESIPLLFILEFHVVQNVTLGSAIKLLSIAYSVFSTSHARAESWDRCDGIEEFPTEVKEISTRDCKGVDELPLAMTEEMVTVLGDSKSCLVTDTHVDTRWNGWILSCDEIRIGHCQSLDIILKEGDELIKRGYPMEY